MEKQDVKAERWRSGVMTDVTRTAHQPSHNGVAPMSEGVPARSSQTQGKEGAGPLSASQLPW